jgi:hypothetical protein
MPRVLAWQNIQTLNSRSYKCGYCGNPLASDKAYYAYDPNVSTTPIAFIYLCHHCFQPTFFDPNGKQTPGVVHGDDVSDVDDSSVKDLYDEARRCTGAGAFTAAVLACRKLLMHIAVSTGAEEGKQFIYYVQYLSDNNYIPPGAKGWVDHIRAKGNEANHQIVIMREDNAKDLLAFIEMLLKIIYEFPANIRRKTTPPAPPPSSP